MSIIPAVHFCSVCLRSFSSLCNFLTPSILKPFALAILTLVPDTNFSSNCSTSSFWVEMEQSLSSEWIMIGSLTQMAHTLGCLFSFDFFCFALSSRAYTSSLKLQFGQMVQYALVMFHWWHTLHLANRVSGFNPYFRYCTIPIYFTEIQQTRY